MNDPIRLQGRWWLPEHEDHQVFGTFTWDLDGGGTLLLQDELHPVVWLDNVLVDGSVQKYRDDRGETPQTYPIIFGQVDHRAYTLLDSFQIGAREFDLDDRVEKVHVNRFLEGAFFDDPDELRVDRVFIEMRHLTSWFGHTGLRVEWSRLDSADEDVFATVTAKALPAFSTDLGGVSLHLTQSLRGTGDRLHDLGVAQQWNLRLKTAEPEPVDIALDIANHFQHLVSIATGQTAQFEKVVLHHPNVPLMSGGGTPIGDRRDDITYYARWSNRTAPSEPVKTHDMYFTFDDLGGIDGVRRWLTVAANYKTELARVMATRYRDGMVLEDRIMNACAALDSLDMHRRKTEKRVDYVKRIQECADLAGQSFADLIVIDSAEWAARVVIVRDDLAHHRENFRTDGSAGDHLLAEQLFWLFTICMLRLTDAPEAVYAAITKHPQIRWLFEQAQAAKRG